MMIRFAVTAQVMAACWSGSSAWGLEIVPVPAATQAALRELPIARYSLQRLELKQRADRTETIINLGGVESRLAWKAHSIRAQNFRARRQDADGVIRTVTAPPPSTYWGTVEGQPGASSAASIRNGQVHAAILTGGATWILQPLSSVVAGAEPGVHLVYAQSDALAGPWTCGADDLDMPHPPAGAQGGIAGAPTDTCLRLAEIAFDADFEFYELNNSSFDDTVADIEAVMTVVDFIYRRDCGITYAITDVLVRTAEPDPYSATGSGQLLGEFRDHWNANETAIARDVAHLMTGKEIDGSVIGIAYLPGVCTDGWGYGLSQSRFTKSFSHRVRLTAHEIGHNWNAPHCGACPANPAFPCQDSCSIMCSCVSGCVQDVVEFEPCTASVIMAYRDSLTCLDPGGAATSFAFSPLPPDIPGSGDRFGASVAMSGNLAIIGAPLHDPPQDSGAAYVFSRTDGLWTQQAMLLAPDAAAMDRFGISVALTATDDGRVAVVGAPLDDNLGKSSGSAYVVEGTGTTGWATPSLLTPLAGGVGDRFGHSVAVGLGYVAVGAPFRGANDAGSVFVFKKGPAGWAQFQELMAADPSVFANFGISVEMIDGEDEWLAVGAWQATGAEPLSGAVYVFHRQGDVWIQQQKLTASDGAAGDGFGQSVAIDGELIVVGAPYHRHDGASKVGAVYVFAKQGDMWTEAAMLTAGDGMGSDQFGYSVAVDNGLVAVGAYLHDAPVEDAGAVYLYRADVGALPLAKLTRDDAAIGDQFGYSVAVQNDIVVAGAWRADINGVDSGAAFVTAGLSIVDCNENGIADDCDILQGTSEDVNGDGVPDECAPPPACPPDVTHDGQVNFDDILALLADWGACPSPPTPCPSDIAPSPGDGVVNFDDILVILMSWGPCES